ARTGAGLRAAARAGGAGARAQPVPTMEARRGGGAPPFEMLFVLAAREALRAGLLRARDLVIDSAPILAWRRRDPDAASGHAPAHHPRPLLRGFRVHTLLCRGSGLPLFFLLSPANAHDAPFAKLLLAGALHFYRIRPRIVRLEDRKSTRLNSSH